MRTIEERFWAKVEKSEECWNWTAATVHNGYGQFTIKPGLAHRAHRFAYQLKNGEVPAGMFLDHICRNRKCVRPEHLRIVTPGENVQNQDGHSDSRSGRRGVAWHGPSGKWRATAQKDGTRHYAGLFADVEEAAEAARQLRLKIHTHNDLDRMATK